MGNEVECTNCETKFEITISDYLIAEGEPQITYCPNCGKATLE